MRDISSKTAGIFIGVALIISLIGLFSLSEGGISSITGLGTKEGQAVLADVTPVMTVLIMLVITIALLIILIKKRSNYNKTSF